MWFQSIAKLHLVVVSLHNLKSYLYFSLWVVCYVFWYWNNFIKPAGNIFQYDFSRTVSSIAGCWDFSEINLDLKMLLMYLYFSDTTTDQCLVVLFEEHAQCMNLNNLPSSGLLAKLIHNRVRVSIHTNLGWQDPGQFHHWCLPISTFTSCFKPVLELFI